jgi:hypothetical protein
VGVVCGAALALVLASGCGRERRGPGYFTRQNFETIYTGQPSWAVEEKLGRPEQRHVDSWVYVNERPYYRAVIHFADGRVTKTEWSYEPPEGDSPSQVGGP